MTSPDDPEGGDPRNGGKATGDENNRHEDELNLAYLPPPGTHSSRAYYANADERIQSALAHVNPARAVSFLRKTPQNQKWAPMRDKRRSCAR